MDVLSSEDVGLEMQSDEGALRKRASHGEHRHAN
jgi:hypothetical protein